MLLMTHHSHLHQPWRLDRYKTLACSLTQVLVAGGFTTGSSPTSAAEIYDPVARTWSFAATMPIARSIFEMQTLPSGQVFVGGGVSGPNVIYANDTLIYSPVANTWTNGTGLLFTNQNDFYRPSGVLYRH